MSETKTGYTAAEALKALNGISKKRLYAMMKDGEISYHTEEWGSGTRRVIEGSELARVFGSKFKPEETNETKQETVSNSFKKPPETNETTNKNIAIQVELELLRERIKDKDEVISGKDKAIDDLRIERDDWKKQAQTLLLQDHSKKPILKPVEGNENFSGTGEPKNEKGYSGAKFSAIAATILLAFGLGGAGVYFWPEIEARLNGAGSSEILAERSKTGDLNSLAPAAGEKKEGQGVILPENRNYTPAPDLLHSAPLDR